MNVLFLPAWYPHRRDAMFGLFVRKHARAVARYAEVHVLYAVAEAGLRRSCFETCREDPGLTEYYLYYPPARTGIGAIWRDFMARRRLWRRYKRENGLPDLIHVHVLTRRILSACRIKRRYGVPFVLTEHSGRYMRGAFNGRWRRRLSAWAVRQASAVLPVSAALGQGMRACGLDNPHYEVVRNVVDEFFFEPFEVESLASPWEDGPSDRVGAVRTLQPRPSLIKAGRPKSFVHICCFEEFSKNNFGLLRAVQSLWTRRQDFTLYMIGNGTDFEATRAYAETLGLADAVVFTGEQSPYQVRAYLAQVDFSVLFSHFETASVVVAESLSAGKPVVSTALPAVIEVLDAQNSLLVPIADETALCEALDRMLDHCADYAPETMRKRAKALFSFDSVGHQLLGIYQTVLSTSRCVS